MQNMQNMRARKRKSRIKHLKQFVQKSGNDKSDIILKIFERKLIVWLNKKVLLGQKKKKKNDSPFHL